MKLYRSNKQTKQKTLPATVIGRFGGPRKPCMTAINEDVDTLSGPSKEKTYSTQAWIVLTTRDSERRSLLIPLG